MASNRIHCTLGDVLTLQRGFDLPAGNRKPGAVPIVASTGVAGFHNVAMVHGPGVVLGRSGSIGGGQYVQGAYWPLNTTLWVKDFKGNHPLFCYYLLKSIDFTTLNVGGAVPTLNRNHAYLVEVELPSLPEQSNIAAILGALDDRIENLRATNETLEAITQTWFKSWFVAFDPVKAKAAGEAPAGMDAETAKLFPSEFDEAGVPFGWAMSTVGDVFTVTMGQSPPGSTYNQESTGVPFFQGSTDFGFLFPQNRVFCTAPTRLAKGGDTLVSVRAPVGTVNIALEDCAIGRGVAAVRHGTCEVFAHVAMKMLKHYFATFEADGTVFGSINKEQFLGLPMLRPSFAVMNAFEGLAGTLLALLREGELESRNLAQVRDELLPKLITGELRLPGFEDSGS